jgi:hypothetical protein
MGQPKERSAKKNVFVEKYDEIRSFDGTFRLLHGIYHIRKYMCFVARFSMGRRLA